MKILVRGTNWVGDAVMSIPAISHLKTLFPEAHISLLTRSWAEGIFRDSEAVDEIISFEKTKSSISNLFGVARNLRKREFDAAIVFPNSFESALSVRLGGVKRIFGYSSEGRRIILSDPIPVPTWKDEVHEVNYYLHLVANFGLAYGRGSGEPPTDVPPVIKVSEERLSRAKEMLASEGIASDERIVALGIGSANSEAKRWPAEYYARLGDAITASSGARILLVGSKDDLRVADEVISKSSGRPISFVGKTNIADAVAMLASVDLMISNDMGLAHVAPATGTPTITLFGPTKDNNTRPLANHSHVLRKPVDCAPCMLRQCPIDHRCMRHLTPESVLTKALEVLAK